MLKKKNKRNLVITKKDRNLFKYLYENKIANVRQICRDVFKYANMAATRRRLKRLKEKGFLKGISLARKARSFKAYSITPKAFDCFLSNQFEDITRRQFESHSPFHDMDLVDIRHCLERGDKIVKYFTENIIQSGSGCLEGSDIHELIEHNPDAILNIEVGNKYYDFCLEYEASLKSKERCEDFLKKYYFDKNVAAVLFIYEEETIFKRILSMEKKIFSNMTPKFYYCSFEKIQSKEKILQFTNAQNTSLKISQSVPSGCSMSVSYGTTSESKKCL